MTHIRTAMDRRFAPRIRVDMFLNQYVNDLPFRALATNMGPSGLLIQKLFERSIPLNRVVSVEFEIPGTGETVWARAESRFDTINEDFHTSGLIFTGMAGKHERMLREFVLERARSWRTGPKVRVPS